MQSFVPVLILDVPNMAFVVNAYTITVKEVNCQPVILLRKRKRPTIVP
jgi:hypothetical protein